MPSSMPASIIQQDSESRPYWEGLRQGELRIQRCDVCGRAVFYPRALCPYCHSAALSWITATGRGTIYSYTVVHQAFGPFAGDIPYFVAIVELEEGVRMMTRILDAPQEWITIGAEVRVSFEQVSDDLTLPYFRLNE